MNKEGQVVGTTPAEQATQALKNLQAVATSNGFTLNDAVKVTVFLVNMDHFAEVNKVYTEFFTGENPPARSCVAVSGLPKGVLFEIEANFFKA